MKIEFELTDRQAAALRDILPLVRAQSGKAVDEVEFCRLSAVQSIIAARQQQIAADLQ